MTTPRGLAFISYCPGTGGKFIKALIKSMMTGEQISISDLGNAHDNDDSQFYVDTRMDRQNRAPTRVLFSEIREINGDRLTHGHGHAIGLLHIQRVERCFEEFPDARIIYIMHSPEDLESIRVNLFFKFFLEYRGDNHRFQTGSMRDWHDMLERRSETGIDANMRPWDIRGSDLRMLLDGMEPPFCFGSWDQIPPRDQRILVIHYRDIMDGKASIVDAVGAHLGLRPGPQCYMAMKRYARAQPRLNDLLCWFDP